MVKIQTYLLLYTILEETMSKSIMTSQRSTFAVYQIHPQAPRGQAQRARSKLISLSLPCAARTKHAHRRKINDTCNIVHLLAFSCVYS